MNLLILAGFNNYENRTIRKPLTVQDAIDNSEGYWWLLNTQFKFNDGISSQTVPILASDFGNEPDYVLVVDENNNIESRWFVIETVKNSGSKKVLTLRRDLVADYYEDLKNADCFIERGLCSTMDPLIYNDEGMNLNKIKKSEYLLKDESKTPWIVGYMDPTQPLLNVKATLEPPDDFLTIPQLSSETGIPQTILNDLFNDQTIKVMNGWWSYIFKGAYSRNGDTGSFEIYLSQDLTEYKGKFDTFTFLKESFWLRGNITDGPTAASLMARALINQPNIKDAFIAESGIDSSDYLTTKQYEALMNVTKPVKYGNNYYSFTLSKGAEELKYPAKKLVNTNTTFLNALNSLPSLDSRVTNIYPNTAEYRVAGRFADLKLTKTLLQVGAVKANVIGGPARNTLKSRPYQMFCMPYFDTKVVSNVTTSLVFTSKQEAVMAIVSQLAIKDESEVYDIQLLPYCPMRKAITNEDILPLKTTGMTIEKDYDIIYETVEGSSDIPVGVIYYPDTDSGECAISKTCNIDTDPKFDSNAKMMRIMSPTYQGAFDFNVAKNNGVDGFIAKWTYKPFTPYIRVAPNFSGLYGGEFNDQRGLICGGNFSLTRVKDRWLEFELNNKNYQNIFNREIQSLDLQQSIQRQEAIFGATAGTVQQTVQGAQAGFMASGSPYGAIAGAAIGLTTGAVGGALDVSNLANLQKDQRSLQIDKFNYNLANIKALPNTLTKLDMFDISSKFFPFLEEYGPTDEEKELFQEKIRLQSYTLMRIEKLGNQMTEEAPLDINALHYVKGQLIRTEDTQIDAHTWAEIYAEISKGVYI